MGWGGELVPEEVQTGVGTDLVAGRDFFYDNCGKICISSCLHWAQGSSSPCNLQRGKSAVSRWLQGGAGHETDQGRIRELGVEPLFLLEGKPPRVREQDGCIFQVTDAIIGAYEVKSRENTKHRFL